MIAGLTRPGPDIVTAPGVIPIPMVSLCPATSAWAAPGPRLGMGGTALAGGSHACGLLPADSLAAYSVLSARPSRPGAPGGSVPRTAPQPGPGQALCRRGSCLDPRSPGRPGHRLPNFNGQSSRRALTSSSIKLPSVRRPVVARPGLLWVVASGRGDLWWARRSLDGRALLWRRGVSSWKGRPWALNCQHGRPGLSPGPAPRRGQTGRAEPAMRAAVCSGVPQDVAGGPNPALGGQFAVGNRWAGPAHQGACGQGGLHPGPGSERAGQSRCRRGHGPKPRPARWPPPAPRAALGG